MICKTLKWMLLSGAVLGGAGFLFLGTDFPGYLGTMASSVRESVTGAIPVEIELKRAEGLIRQIDPQIDRCKLDLARAQIELENLQNSISNLEKVTGVEEKKLKDGAKLLCSEGTADVMLASDSGSHRRRINAALVRTKDSYVNNVAMLKTKRALIERQTRAVEAASQRLDAVRHERIALEDQVATLKTQKMQVEALTAQSKRFNLDDSALSQAKEVIAHVKERLDVAQRMLENDIVFHGEDPVEVAVEQRNVLKEINELFAGGETTTAAVQIMLPAQR